MIDIIKTWVRFVLLRRWNKLEHYHFDYFVEEGGLNILNTKAKWKLYRQIRKANKLPFALNYTCPSCGNVFYADVNVEYNCPCGEVLETEWYESIGNPAICTIKDKK
jgi:ribosomal protein S27AE